MNERLSVKTRLDSTTKRAVNSAVPRKPYCGGSAERLGIECRFCSPTRAERHQATCRGLRDWWHVLSGEHVRLATWDWQESVFMHEQSTKRYVALLELHAQLSDRLAGLSDGNRPEQPTERSVEKTVAPESRTTLRREAAQRGEEPPEFDGADTVRPDEADGIEAVRRYRRERADQHSETQNAKEK